MILKNYDGVLPLSQYLGDFRKVVILSDFEWFWVFGGVCTAPQHLDHPKNDKRCKTKIVEVICGKISHFAQSAHFA